MPGTPDTESPENPDLKIDLQTDPMDAMISARSREGRDSSLRRRRLVGTLVQSMSRRQKACGRSLVGKLGSHRRDAMALSSELPAPTCCQFLLSTIAQTMLSGRL